MADGRIREPLAKTSFDRLVAGVLLCMLAPLLCCLAVGVLVTMGRPVFFRQTRSGRGGEPFVLVKFRTMRQGGGADEHRMTAFGSWLRSTSLDELPELWNVWRGEMSLVGPRPLLMEYLPLYSAHQARRLLVKPGLTGLAQVSGRNCLTWEERFDLDVMYVDSMSVGADLRILWRTASAVTRREGISEPGQATMTPFRGWLGEVDADQDAA